MVTVPRHVMLANLVIQIPRNARTVNRLRFLVLGLPAVVFVAPERFQMMRGQPVSIV